eukprot:scaffold398665_cov52-Prasinocladus_malaysianus.AAC.1
MHMSVSCQPSLAMFNCSETVSGRPQVAGRVQSSLVWAVSGSFALLGAGITKTSEAMGHKRGRPPKR